MGLTIFKIIYRFALLLAFAMPCIASAIAAERYALVIGNNAYANLPAAGQLQKALNDAEAMRDTLVGDLGFSSANVFFGENQEWAQMNALIKQLETAVGEGDLVFIYYSGHGMSIQGENYLLPTDIPTPKTGEEDRLKGNSFGAEELTKRMKRRGAQAIFMVLDACRNNPFFDEGGKAVSDAGGLAKFDSAKGVFALFAAGIGQTALDRLSETDRNPNSVFTRSLIPLLKTPGLSQTDLAKRVQKEVAALASTVGHSQEPAYYDEIIGLVTINDKAPSDPGTSPPPQPTPASTTGPARDDTELAQSVWAEIRDSNDPNVFDILARQYPSTIYAEFARNRAAQLRDAQIASAPPAQEPVQEPVQEPAPPEEPLSWFLATYRNVDLFGEDIFPRGLSAPGGRECSAMCGENLSCRAYTYNYAAKICFLKSGYEFAQTVADVESGFFYRARASDPPPAFQAQWEVFVKMDLRGNDFGRHPATNYRDCLTACQSTQGCTGLTYVHFTKPDQCWLKGGDDLQPFTSRAAIKGATSARMINQTIRPDAIQPAYARN